MKIGTIVFIKKGIASKSEGYYPYLYEGEGKFLSVCLEGDSSLHGDGLRPYDGKRVELTGEMDEEYGTFFRAETIREMTVALSEGGEDRAQEEI